MKLKEFRPQGGRTSPAPHLDPPLDKIELLPTAIEGKVLLAMKQNKILIKLK